MKRALVMILCLFTLLASALASSAENLILISLDGVRWQDVYRGYEPKLYSANINSAIKQRQLEQFGGSSASEKRTRLMPFLWSKIANNGLLLGNRDINSAMTVNNSMWFSYPGYNELLTGKADPTIRDNAANNNKNVTFLEWLNQQPIYQHKVAVFGSWDVFPAIINRQRSGLPINAGFESAHWQNLSERTEWLNQLQQNIPSPWHNVRLDAFTMGFAEEYVEQFKPKVLYLALGETDDFAHNGSYWQYVDALHRADSLIANLWQKLQSMPEYAGKTNLIITTDHGRGETLKSWPHHGSPEAVKGYINAEAEFKNGIVGSNEIWLAAMGPDVKQMMANDHPLGEQKNTQRFSLDQVAATALRLLNIKPDQFNDDIGKAIEVNQQ
ncbi:MULTISPECIES: alkaline phosphatase family protein [Aliiglaciecola]|uniref:alkaline phosphatase family protein n=1 Tax=Aliiglaciecola TaxID=1406885 RepID=UPI0020919F45|nr:MULTISPECIES: alkaline phosphatase family protein [Aliiglaciecola]MDO6713110.1 alkaline phosphatase family protein [Aliiglaciecola sp. 2_MG-2023]MDO6754124.1 alkaline phosphatase family protein [Aliiglaciecola sp. 1_MG-2023]